MCLQVSQPSPHVLHLLIHTNIFDLQPRILHSRKIWVGAFCGQKESKLSSATGSRVGETYGPAVKMSTLATLALRFSEKKFDTITCWVIDWTMPAVVLMVNHRPGVAFKQVWTVIERDGGNVTSCR
jgi:hypothetical protein